jgi:hypothetical protein
MPGPTRRPRLAGSASCCRMGNRRFPTPSSCQTARFRPPLSRGAHTAIPNSCSMTSPSLPVAAWVSMPTTASPEFPRRERRCALDNPVTVEQVQPIHLLLSGPRSGQEPPKESRAVAPSKAIGRRAQRQARRRTPWSCIAAAQGVSHNLRYRPWVVPLGSPRHPRLTAAACPRRRTCAVAETDLQRQTKSQQRRIPSDRARRSQTSQPG